MEGGDDSLASTIGHFRASRLKPNKNLWGGLTQPISATAYLAEYSKNKPMNQKKTVSASELLFGKAEEEQLQKKELPFSSGQDKFSGCLSPKSQPCSDEEQIKNSIDDSVEDESPALIPPGGLIKGSSFWKESKKQDSSTSLLSKESAAAGPYLTSGGSTPGVQQVVKKTKIKKKKKKKKGVFYASSSSSSSDESEKKLDFSEEQAPVPKDVLGAQNHPKDIGNAMVCGGDTKKEHARVIQSSNDLPGYNNVATLGMDTDNFLKHIRSTGMIDKGKSPGIDTEPAGKVPLHRNLTADDHKEKTKLKSRKSYNDERKSGFKRREWGEEDGDGAGSEEGSGRGGGGGGGGGELHPEFPAPRFPPGPLVPLVLGPAPAADNPRGAAAEGEGGGPGGGEGARPAPAPGGGGGGEGEAEGGAEEGGAAAPGAVAVPAAINRYLRDYQQEGIRFMYSCYEKGKGAILADEMGLGKTIQVIGLIAAILGKQGLYSDKQRLRKLRQDGLVNSTTTPGSDVQSDEAPPCRRGVPILLSVPASLLDNWLQEFNRWGHFDVHKLEGNLEEREYLLSKADQGKIEILVCSKDTLRSFNGPISRVKWHAVFFDEFHEYKNPKSQTSKAAGALRTRRKFGLTGTPWSNSLDEMHPLVDLVQPGLLGEKKAFREYFAMPIKRGQKRSAAGEILLRARQRELELGRVLRRVMIQRDKSVIQDQLKGKQVNIIFCPLTEVQYTLYERALALPDVRLCVRGLEPCDCGREGRQRSSCCYQIPPEDQYGNIDPRAVLWLKSHETRDGYEACPFCPRCLSFAVIAKLQKIANHPALLQVDPQTQSAAKQAEVRRFAEALGLDALAPVGGAERPRNFLELCRTDTCGKMRALAGLLAKSHGENARLAAAEKHKVLVFSWSTQMLDIIQAFAKSQGYSHMRLDGSTPQSVRQSMIDKFNNDPTIFLFLVSTRAGGVGLNLTSANRVVLFDVNWNPAQDAQAQDRAFRPGQTRRVQVYCLVAQGCIEEVAYMRQLYKLRLGEAPRDRRRSSGGGARTAGGAVGGATAAAAAAAGGAEHSKRQFEAVQGDPEQRGELFGLANLLALQRGSILKLLRRRHARRIARAASLDGRVAEIKASGDDEDEEELLKVLSSALENEEGGDDNDDEEAAVLQEEKTEEDDCMKKLKCMLGIKARERTKTSTTENVNSDGQDGECNLKKAECALVENTKENLPQCDDAVHTVINAGAVVACDAVQGEVSGIALGRKKNKRKLPLSFASHLQRASQARSKVLPIVPCTSSVVAQGGISKTHRQSGSSFIESVAKPMTSTGDQLIANSEENAIVRISDDDCDSLCNILDQRNDTVPRRHLVTASLRQSNAGQQVDLAEDSGGSHHEKGDDKTMRHHYYSLGSSGQEIESSIQKGLAVTKKNKPSSSSQISSTLYTPKYNSGCS